MARRSTAGTPGVERGKKSALIRKYIAHPAGYKNPEIARMIEAEGIRCNAQDVANMRAKLKKFGIIASGGPALSIDDLLKVKSIAEEAGGIKEIEKSIQALEGLAEQVGGLDRLKRGLAALQRLKS